MIKRSKMIMIKRSSYKAPTNVCFYYIEFLAKYASKKKRYLRANHSLFMNKCLEKEIMKRSRLRNKFLKNPTPENKVAYNKQRNYCLTLSRKTKKEYF